MVEMVVADQKILGILSLDTRFPRIVGDAGASESYPFPCEIAVVDGAYSNAIVQDSPPSADILSAFIDAARELEATGVSAIVSTCGFLVTAQEEIAQAVNIPVMLSALSMFSATKLSCPGRIGILTASAASLGQNVLHSAGISMEEVAIVGLDKRPLFAKTFLSPKESQLTEFDRNEMESLVLEETEKLVSENADISAIILECGNLPPYAHSIRRKTGKPVFSIIDGANWMM